MTTPLLTRSRQSSRRRPIDTYDDHRMAMSFALVALAGVPVRINDPNCVAKTFPTFFDEFQKILTTMPI
jgi:3-phosphoshikimate 1-carboxyvinyltransferase